MAVITRIFGFEGKTSDAILLHVNKECCRKTQSGVNLSDRNLKKKKALNNSEFVQNKLSVLVLKTFF